MRFTEGSGKGKEYLIRQRAFRDDCGRINAIGFDMFERRKWTIFSWWGFLGVSADEEGAIKSIDYHHNNKTALSKSQDIFA